MADLTVSTPEVPPWKRAEDYILAGLLLIAVSPVIVLAMVVVKLTSPGPAIYSQTRLGLNRRRFTMYKIRTMRHNCEATTGARWATKGDPRQTFVGRILRATHIDELPQLWNVLRGEMSLVGPRPERPEIVEKIEPQIRSYAARLSVLPGLTGLAQVQLPPDFDIDDVRRKVRCDVHYADHSTLWLDIRLILATSTRMLGIPFAVTQRLLRIPTIAEIESVLERVEDDAVVPFGPQITN
jgi:lipopolysaccharide/colanic/teichoic acid biosynthesis glycosyltransferase